MIKHNSYKTNRIKLILFIILSIVGIIFLLNSANYKNLIKSEIQGFQQNFLSFSSALQLFDQGHLQQSDQIKIEDYTHLSKKFISILYYGILKDKNENLSDLSLFIKFKNLNKIYSDRDRAISIGYNSNPTYVPCKISDGIVTLKCEVRLKGDLEDHWYSKTRFSLRIRVKGGYINGLQHFSVQKPRARQFPYDQTFHKINSDLGGISSNDQRFINFKVNNQNWGVMNLEPRIDDKFIEARSIKRSGVFRISNQDNWIYRNESFFLRNNHFLSDPTLYLSQRKKKSLIIKDENTREIYSYIFHTINRKNSKIFERQKMIDSILLALSWGYLHTLYNSNSLYTWNSYMHNLEPILADQGHWQSIESFLKKLEYLPYEYANIFKTQPITKEEYNLSISKIDEYFLKNDPIKIANKLKIENFPNDRMFKISPVLKNLDFLKNNSDDVISKINILSKKKIANNIATDKQILNYSNLIKDFIEVIHFTNGDIEIYNLLSKKIFIKNIVINNQEIKVNEFIRPSKINQISKIIVKTDFKGFYDSKISVSSIFQNTEKISQNNFTLFDFKHFDKNNFHEDKDICKNHNSNEICIVSGKHIINQNIKFENPVIIEEGSKLILLDNINLLFRSSVEMNGSKNKPIFILGNGGSIMIKNSFNSVSKINNVNFSNLNNMSLPLMRYTGAINGYGGTFVIKDSKIFGGKAEDQLNLVHAKINISNLFFENAISDAFDCDVCNGSISNLKINNVNGDGLDFSSSNLNISNIYINSVKDKAISIGEKSNIKLKDVFIENAATGIAVKDSSHTKIDKITMNNIKFDSFMTYIKKPYFNGKTILKANNAEINYLSKENFCVRAKNTYLEINGNECNIIDLNVDALYEEGRMKK